MLTDEYCEYMTASHRDTDPYPSHLVITWELDRVSMYGIEENTPGMLDYELLLLTGCLIDDLCGDPVR